MSLDLIFRTDRPVGDNYDLTPAEIDGNFKALRTAVTTLQTGSTAPATKVPSDFTGLVAPGFVAPGDPRLISKVENDNPGIIQSVGAWLPDTGGVYSNNSAIYTKDVNPILKMPTYYGIGIIPVSQTDPSYAPYEVWEGNNKVATVTLATSSPQSAHALSPIVLPEGIHNLEYRYLNPNGTLTCLFDATQLVTSPTPVTGSNATVSASNDWSGIPNPLDFTGDTFSDRFEAALAAATAAGGRRAVIVTESAITSRALLMPGDFTLFVAGSIQRGGGVYDNIIRSANTANPGNIPTAPLRNVKIIGLGNGTIAGISDGWGSDNPANVSGQAWRSTALLLANVEDFEVSGLRFFNTNSWATCFEQCRYGKITNLTFDQRGISPNQDGIDIRDGSHDILIENISGGTYDDMLALTNLPGYAQNKVLGTTIYEVDRRTNLLRTERNIYNIIARNFARNYTAEHGPLDSNQHHLWGGFLLLGSSAAGRGIHNVTIDGIAGVQQIYIAFDSATYNYTDGNPSGVDDIYNINVSNTGEAGILVRRPIKNSSFTNVAPTDIFGQPALVLPAGCQNIYRRYQNAAPEFITAS